MAWRGWIGAGLTLGAAWMLLFSIEPPANTHPDGQEGTASVSANATPRGSNAADAATRSSPDPAEGNGPAPRRLAVDPKAGRAIADGPVSARDALEATISGRVRAGNRPLAGAHVTWLVARSLTPPHPMLKRSAARREQTALLEQLRTSVAAAAAVSDSDGSYTLARVPVGEQIVLVATPAGGLPQGFTFDVEAPQTYALDLDVEATYRIEGRVLDRDTRAPLAHVEVSGGTPRTGFQRLADTDERGLFWFPHSEGTHAISSDLKFSKTGYLPLTTTRVPADGVIPLTPALRILGKITDPAGTPQEGALVVAFLAGPDGSATSVSPCASGETDASGRFALQTRRTDDRIRIQAQRRGTEFRFELGVFLQPRATDLVADGVLPHAGVVEGAVTIAAIPTRATVQWQAGDHTGLLRTENDGLFRIEGVPVGAVRLEATTLNPPMSVGATAHVAVGRTTHAVLDLPPPLGVLAGRVRGHAVAAGPIEVCAEGSNGSKHVAHTEADGSFALTVPADPSIEYRVWIRDRDKRRIQFGIRPGRSNLLFEVDPPTAMNVSRY